MNVNVDYPPFSPKREIYKKQSASLLLALHHGFTFQRYYWTKLMHQTSLPGRWTVGAHHNRPYIVLCEKLANLWVKVWEKCPIILLEYGCLFQLNVFQNYRKFELTMAQSFTPYLAMTGHSLQFTCNHNYGISGPCIPGTHKPAQIWHEICLQVQCFTTCVQTRLRRGFHILGTVISQRDI